MSQLRRPLDWVNDRPLRERVLIGATTLIVTVASADWLMLQPIRESERTYTREIEQLHADVADRQAAFMKKMAELQRHETTQGETALRKLRNEITRLKNAVDRGALSTISPTDMVAVLHQMFEKDAAVTLTVVENAAPEPVVGLKTTVDEQERFTPMLFKHPLTLEFTGSYTKIVEFLKRIEGLDWHLIWDDFSIVMEDYPTARARIVLHTLSLEKGWVGA